MDLDFFFSLLKVVTLGIYPELSVKLLTGPFPLFKTLWLSACTVLEFCNVSSNTANTCDHWKCNMKAQVLLIRALIKAALLNCMAGSHFTFMVIAEAESKQSHKSSSMWCVAYEAVLLTISELHSYDLYNSNTGLPCKERQNKVLTRVTLVT